MDKKNILISLPNAFSIRAFYLNDIIKKLSDVANVSVLTDFATDKNFLATYGYANVKLYKYCDYKNKNIHAKCLKFLEDVNAMRWNLFVTSHLDRQNYFFTHKKEKIEPITLKYKIKKHIIRFFSRSRFFIKMLRNIENYFFLKQHKNDNVKYYKDLFQNIKPDLVIATFPSIIKTIPLFKTSKLLDIPTFYYVLSHDNVTTKKNLTINFDKYFVWNKRNKNELLNQYLFINEQNIEVCGPLSFDWHHNNKISQVNRKSWKEKYNLPIDSKVVLIGTAVERTGAMEPYVLKKLLKNVKDNKINNKINFIVRLHPNDQINRWEKIINDHPEIPFIKSMSLKMENGGYISSKDDIDSLTDDILNSEIIITAFSSIALDACRLNKPSIFLGFDEQSGSVNDNLCKEFFYREHIYPQVSNGGVKVARSIEDLTTHINDVIDNNNINFNEIKNTAKAYDPFLDNRASERLIKHIDRFLN